MTDVSKWTGRGIKILNNYLNSETGLGSSDAGSFGMDAFINGIEDEFPGDPDDVATGTYIGYSIEANRASELRPWGQPFGNRPKVHELNQPPAAQALGWRILDFYPNRDVKSDFYRVAGTPAELRTLLQTIQLIRQATGNRIDFDEWFKQWEKGFPDANLERGLGNFKLTGEQAWERIKHPEKRPRWREWNTSQQRADTGIRTGEYWRDRSNEGESFILSGTDLDLIRHIVQIEYEGGGSAGITTKGSNVSVVGLPQITLIFMEDPNKVDRKPDGSKYAPMRAEITFRIPNKTDDPLVNLDKISKADIKAYATKILAVFNGYIWRRGKKIVSYNSPRQGMSRTWYEVRNKQQGVELINKILSITNQTFNPKLVRISEALDEALTFPANPQPITVLGEKITPDRKRPLVDVIFSEAKIGLSQLKHDITLVKRGRVVYDP